MTVDTSPDQARGPDSLAGRRDRRDRGTALIELTLVLPLLLLLTLAVVDFGRAFYVKNVLEQAAREGVRLRAVTSSADSAQVRDRVLTVANAAGVSVQGLQIEGPFPDRNVHVEVTGEFHWIFPGMFNLFGANFTNPMSLTGEAWMRNEGSS